MNSAQQNLQNEWSPNIVTQKEVDFEFLVGDWGGDFVWPSD